MDGTFIAMYVAWIGMFFGIHNGKKSEIAWKTTF